MTTTENKWFQRLPNGLRGRKRAENRQGLFIPIVTQEFEAAIRAVAQHRRRPLDGEWQLLRDLDIRSQSLLRALQPGE